MLSHSHRVTFGHTEFHLSICFPLFKASEVFLQGQTVMNMLTGIYVPLQDSHLRTKDLMLSGKSFINIRNRIGLKTKPRGTPDNTAVSMIHSPSRLLMMCTN